MSHGEASQQPDQQQRPMSVSAYSPLTFRKPTGTVSPLPADFPFQKKKLIPIVDPDTKEGTKVLKQTLLHLPKLYFRISFCRSSCEDWAKTVTSFRCCTRPVWFKWTYFRVPCRSYKCRSYRHYYWQFQILHFWNLSKIFSKTQQSS